MTATDSGVAGGHGAGGRGGHSAGGRGGHGAGGRRRRGERAMVPDAAFTSYYGRPVLKAAPWTADIPSYMFLGGLAAGSSLLGAGAELTGRPTLRRSARLTAFAAISASTAALIHDLGRPSRFHHMLRVAKVSSPMSVGTWILTGYGPLAAVAGLAEFVAGPRAGRWLPRPLRPPLALLSAAARPAGLGAASLAPAVATYTAVLLSDTATPAWHEGWRELPYVFAGSAAMASGGIGLMTANVADAGPARRMAVAGAAAEVAAEFAMERSTGLAAETLHEGVAGRLMRAGKALAGIGALGALAGRRSRVVSAVSGAAFVAGSACTRFGIFQAGQASARDPKYTIVPQRERVQRRAAMSGATDG